MKIRILPDDKDMLVDIIHEQIEKITKLERRVEVLRKYITDKLDLDKGDLESIEGFEKEEEEQQIMTSKELEYYINKIEMYSDVFSYGRVGVEEKKMAESL